MNIFISKMPGPAGLWNWTAMTPGGDMLCTGVRPRTTPDEVEEQVEELMTWFRADVTVCVTGWHDGVRTVATYAAEGAKTP